jgi:DNA segregation ATPase FtsK/SpoIIIE-like protein
LAGVDLQGRPRFIDLGANENPHLLVAGTTGSGKTEWLRCALASLICTNTPDTLRLVLIDPRRTAFPDLKRSAYLWDATSLLNPPDHSAIEILQRLVDELESRYQLFQRYGCDNLTQLAAMTARPIPRIVCVCDEYADLATGREQRKEIEDLILRLGSRARSAGIHLIIAMQDPRRELLSPALKSNLGGRVCLKMANYYHSVMMLGERGAERLLGKGDLLYKSIGEPIRLQAPHLTAEERAELFQGPASAELQAAG